MVRILVFWGVAWGPPILENYQLGISTSIGFGLFSSRFLGCFLPKCERNPMQTVFLSSHTEPHTHFKCKDVHVL